MATIILAQDIHDIIGGASGLPWHIPYDMQRFRALTTGGTVVMGRKTWESLPTRPLPRRHNVVITRGEMPGVETYSSVEAALEAYPECWVIGGSEIARAALPYVDRIDLTTVEINVDGRVQEPVRGLASSDIRPCFQCVHLEELTVPATVLGEHREVPLLHRIFERC